MWQNEVCTQFRDDMTNNADWQVFNETMTNLYPAYTSNINIHIDLRCVKYVEETEPQTYWNDNKGALLAFMTQVIE
jgi:hypothetical protein